MLGDNIKTLRKQKGYSQETMAEQLNVVRQTISKWEKGTSVPDAEMLERIANLFEVSVSEFLGNGFSEKKEDFDFNEVANQLAILNQHLAKQARTRKRTLKIVLISLAAVVIIPVFISIVLIFMFSYNKTTKTTQMTTTIESQSTLDEEEYSHEIP